MTKICHIRRDDEVNITYCNMLTAYDKPIQPIVAVGPDAVAVFADGEIPAETRQCGQCWHHYLEANS